MHKNFGTQIFITEKLGQRDRHLDKWFIVGRKKVHKNFGTQIFITEKLGQKDGHLDKWLLYIG